MLDIAAIILMTTKIPAQFDLHNYRYELPTELIAQQPRKNRQDARLLCMLAQGQLKNSYIRQLASHLNPGDLLVLNNSKVLPLRLFGHKEASGTAGLRGGKVEILVNAFTPDGQAEAVLKAARPPPLNSRIIISNNPTAYWTVAAIRTQGEHKLYQLQPPPGQSAAQLCEIYGVLPLPPYIKRQPQVRDQERYQTVYAKEAGSAAAPTAGLHFAQETLTELQRHGVQLCELTLHVGLGTFTPLRKRDVRQHTMHPEYCNLSAAACRQLNQVRQAGGRIIAVGTTSLRTLESCWEREQQLFSPGVKHTNLYIYPGRVQQGADIEAVDALLTNFHQSASSLLLLVCAFVGRARLMAAYQYAISQGYSFLSYGDACLFTRPSSKYATKSRQLRGSTLS